MADNPIQVYTYAGGKSFTVPVLAADENIEQYRLE